MLPKEIQEALDSLLGDMSSEEAETKRKKYAPPEPPAHGVHITIVAGGKHPEPDGDEEPAAEPLEDPGELEKLLGSDEPAPEEKQAPKPKKKRRY